MTPPKKKPDIRIIEHSEKFKSKPQQIESSITQPPEPHHKVIENISYKLVKRALEKEREREKEK